jgi:hypothetical protein
LQLSCVTKLGFSQANIKISFDIGCLFTQHTNRYLR